MGTMNLLQSKWDGKVGELVGAKWKNKATVHAYTKPKDAKTEKQLKQREWFKPMQKTCCLIGQNIKGITDIVPKGMSLGNALVSFNKGLDISGHNIQYEKIQLVRGSEQGGLTMDYRTYQYDWRFVINSTLDPQEHPDLEAFVVIYYWQLNKVEVRRTKKFPYQFDIQKGNPLKYRIPAYCWGRFKRNGTWKYIKQTSLAFPV